MPIRTLVPILWVHNLDESIDFYQRQLGFVCTNRLEGWANLRKGGVELMLSLPNAHEALEKLQFTGSFYFRTEDVDNLWTHLRDNAPVVYPLEDFDYGMREFAIRDNTGYILQFGQELP